ncbi:putative DNA repair protein RAD50 [Calycina marina]|uniref:DNA repair protein RAD50 n=1 Tax=Calycina marina TaxID=1763456 RepID=A0A9P7Z9B5_9HELO|nr:putative DNA repair protein RAD50 [Calycina marina]
MLSLPTSTIDRLQIQGIRNFDNTDWQTIKFNRGCLTLIVGCNGSGKTTIIECLRYATTGMQPPNTKGGAFIRDPQLNQEKEVMAQVKIKFHTPHTQFVVSRQLQCTVKAGNKRSMKSLESAFSMYRDGQKETFSRREGDINKIVTQKLGVSEAILSNVLFCHQDESLWPMGTGLELKKKFDQIFDAVKYTLAVDSLRSQKKNRSHELEKQRILAQGAKKSKDDADKIEVESKDLEVELDVLREQIQEIDVKMSKALRSAQDKAKAAESAKGVVNELKTHTDQASFLQKQIERMETTLELLAESDEWLQAALDQFNDRMDEYKARGAECVTEHKELICQREISQREMSKKQAEQGQYQAEKAAYKRQLENREHLVREAAISHGIRGYDGDLSESQMDDFVSRMRKLLREKDRELERLKSSIEDETSQTSSAVSELRHRRANLEEANRSARRVVNDNDTQSKRIQRQIDDIDIDEGRKAALESVLQDIEERLRRVNKEYDDVGWSQRREAENDAVRNLESEAEKLRADLAQCSKFAEDKAEMKHAQGLFKEAQTGLETMKSAYGDQLSAIIDQDWRVDSIERVYQACLDGKSRAVTEAKKQQEIKKHELDQVTFKLQTLRDTLRKRQDVIDGHRFAVLNSMLDDDGKPLDSIEEFEEEFPALEEELDEAKKTYDGCGYVKDYYSKSLSVANSHDKCRLCERKFADASEKRTVLAKIEKQIAKYTQETYKNALDDLLAKHKKADAVKPRFAQLKQMLSVEIPQLESDSEIAEQARTKLLRVIEKYDNSLSQEESIKRDVEALAKPVNSISLYANDISKYEAKIVSISSQQKLSGSTLSAEELTERSASNAESTRTARAKLDKTISDEYVAKSAISDLEVKLSNARGHLSAAGSALDKKQGLSSQLDQLRTNSKAQRDAMQQTELDSEALVPLVERANSKHDEAVQRGRTKELSIQADKNGLVQTVNSFTHCEKDINTYLQHGGPRNLETCERSIKEIESAQKQIEAKVLKVEANKNDLVDKIKDGQKVKTNIQSNLNHRTSIRELEDLNERIIDLQNRNVQGEYDRLDRQAKKAANEYDVLKQERGPILGESTAKDSQLQKMLQKWELEYKDAARNFRESHIKVETTAAAIDDIEKMRKAVELAIMHYHTTKMEEINTIAREIWLNTYQGTDIDGIGIRSEADTTGEMRKYEYRVVMYKKDVEMDMRGRCSAGQKVLASIIIRLALAECFGVGCGVLALDEPTTNLDRNTVKSLAEALDQLVQQRRSQANFQLVIITHDEEFLKVMHAEKYTETFWRVSRNKDQNSIIVEEPIKNIYGS